MIVPERISSLLSERGISQAELARRVGVAQQTIHKLVSGGARGSSHLHRIARELGTTADYLTGETNDPSEGAALSQSPKEIAEQLGLVGIEQIDLAYGLGATFADGPIGAELMHFPRQWVDAITSSPPALLTWTRGRGDSMFPTINDGDLILLDRSQRRVTEQDALWAFTVGDLAAIKRLRIKGDRVVILSDNPAVPPDEEPIDEVNIVARVAFVGRKI
ncbi:S24 family peptidase [uncultured Sphingomonas sp.]|uniref:S24 family peptidase n=1 Tax=uncultured Sphingomonas sp. TaxID=158754 RepID=UPI0030F8D9C0